MKKILAMILVLAMVLVAFGCAAKPAEETKPAETTQPSTSTDAAATDDAAVEAAQPYNVVCILPMSDAYANTGATMYGAIQGALEYFETVVGGFQSKNVDVQLTLCDLENNTDLAASLFEQNAETMDVGIGCYKTAATIACGALASKYEIPFLNPMSTADAASALETDYVFKLCVSDSQSMTSIANCLEFLESLDTKEYSKASVIHCSDDYGKSISTALQGLVLPMIGWEVGAFEQLQVNQTTDASTAINKAKASGSDITCTVLSTSEAVLVQKQFREYKFDQPVWTGGAGYFDISYFDNTAGAGNYVVCACSWEKCLLEGEGVDPAAFEWYDRVSELAGVPFSEAGATAWAAMGTLLQAVENAASLSRADVTAALNEIELPKEHWANLFTQYSGISFGEVDGLVGVEKLYNANLGASCIFVQGLNNEWELVYNPNGEIANNPVVWPHVPYAE